MCRNGLNATKCYTGVPKIVRSSLPEPHQSWICCSPRLQTWGRSPRLAENPRPPRQTSYNTGGESAEKWRRPFSMIPPWKGVTINLRRSPAGAWK